MIDNEVYKMKSLNIIMSIINFITSILHSNEFDVNHQKGENVS